MATTAKKRDKEMKRREKSKLKEAKREQRKLEKAAKKETGQLGPEIDNSPRNEFIEKNRE